MGVFLLDLELFVHWSMIFCTSWWISLALSLKVMLQRSLSSMNCNMTVIDLVFLLPDFAISARIVSSGMVIWYVVATCWYTCLAIMQVVSMWCDVSSWFLHMMHLLERHHPLLIKLSIVSSLFVVLAIQRWAFLVGTTNFISCLCLLLWELWVPFWVTSMSI